MNICVGLVFFEGFSKNNGIWQSTFFFLLSPSRCLLIDLVHWIKRELKTLKKKSSLVLIHLTPFAWRSGRTSSMLGGAQCKATLVTVRHSPAGYSAERQCSRCKARGRQAAEREASSVRVRGRPSLQAGVGRGQHSYPTQVIHEKPAPELLTSPTLLLANILKCESMRYTRTAYRRCPAQQNPTLEDRFTFAPFGRV